MTLCLFEDSSVSHLYPLVATRAVYDLRLGIRTLAGRLHDAFGRPPLALHTRPDLSAVTAQEHPGTPVNRLPDAPGILFVNGRYVPTEGALLDRLRRAATAAEPARVFVQGENVVAAWIPNETSIDFAFPLSRATFDAVPEEPVDGARLIGRLWELVRDLRTILAEDFAACAAGGGRDAAQVHESALLVEPAQIHLGSGTVVRPGAILNAENGPIFIDEGALIMEGAVVRGPLYLGAHSQVRMAARVETSAFGPGCKVGGEIHDAILHSYSSKAHDGFLGHSYLGRWCNLGADTNTSNLRNDYGWIDLYNEALGTFEASGQQFLGLFMGDHSKCGINTMFNTGTVIGVFCNLFGGDYQPRYVPSFTWGHAQKSVPYRLSKALRVAEAVMARRHHPLTEADRTLLTRIFTAAETNRER